jgi:uncharacterized membrane protein YjgN (DUF898 family)
MPSYVPAPIATAQMRHASSEATARHPITFTGSGSEYFRIWIVNLLLTFVTLGIYYPWARVRKLRYFYGNTQVAGHGLDFHGEPRKMLRGYAIVSVLFVAFSVASDSPTASGIAGLLLAAIWPALTYAGLRFRLSQTSWRGLRFEFHGTLVGVYRTLLPILVPVVILLPMLSLMEQPARGEPAGAAGVVVVSLVLSIFAVLPLVSWMSERYRQSGLGLGNVRAQFSAGPGPFYAIFLKSLLLTLAAALVVGLVLATISWISTQVSKLTGSNSARGFGAWILMMLAMMIVALLGYAAVLSVFKPYFASRMQNLVWNRTESAAMGFDSRLRFRPLLWLSLKNWLLMILTFGLYWPFAAIAMAKMRLEAVDVVAHGDLDALVRGEGKLSKDAAGDAAGDVFGIDVGM